MEYLVYGHRDSYVDDDYWEEIVFDPETNKYRRTEYFNCTFMNVEDDFYKRLKETPQLVIDKYHRLLNVQKRLSEREDFIIARKELGLDNYHEVKRLWKAFPAHYYRWEHLEQYQQYKRICQLLKTKKFRNPFRESLAKQLKVWLKDPNPKYPRPFSPKQLQYI